VVSFSPEKTNPLKAAMASKSLVKIKKFDVNAILNNVVIPRNTVIEPYNEPVNFTCNDSTGPITMLSI
jgi:hypothetical protein